MFENAQLVTLVPDQPGRGGCKQGFHSFLTNPIHDTYSTWGVHIREGSWRADPAASWVDAATYPAWGPYPLETPGSGDWVTKSAYVFNYYSVTAANIASKGYFFSHVYGVPHGGGVPAHFIYRHGYSAQQTSPLQILTAPDVVVPATYAAIQNRLVMAWGYGPAWVWDGSTPTSAGYKIGAPQPANAPGYVLSRPTLTLTTTVSVLKGQFYMTCAEGNAEIDHVKAIKKNARLTIHGVVGYTAAEDAIDDFAPIGSITEWTQLVPGTVKINTPLSPAGAYVGLRLKAAIGGGLYRYGTIRALTVADTVTTITLDNPTNVNYDYTGTYELAGALVKLTATWVGDDYTAGGTNGLASLGYPSGNLSWVGRGPQYAYAWYDYRTGHIGNVSPTIQVTEQDESGVNVELDLSSFSPCGVDHVEAARFTHTVIFRTLLSGGVGLYPIGPLPTVAGAGHHVETVDTWEDQNGNPAGMWMDDHQDTSLAVSEVLIAPQTTNTRPMRMDGTDLATAVACCYWDGRLWLSTLDDPTGISYSCDSQQTLFGVPWECFPSRNRLRIPADDGRVLGFRLFGNRMVVLTERYAYYIAGNHETNYRPLRYSAAMGGVGPYQVDEVPSETDGEESSLVYFHRDKMVYAYTPGNKPKSIGSPIASVLRAYADDYASYQKCRVSVASVDSRRTAILRLEATNTNPARRLFLYDLENGVWTENSPVLGQQVQAIGQHYLQINGSGVSKALFSEGGYFYEWLGYFPVGGETINAYLGPNITTFPLDFGHPKVMKQIDFVRLYVTQVSPLNTPNWTVDIYPNEAYKASGTPVELTQEQHKIFGGGTGSYYPIDGTNVKELVVFPQNMTITGNASTIPSSSGKVAGPLMGYRFKFNVGFAGLAGVRLLALQICWTRVGREGVVTA